MTRYRLFVPGYIEAYADVELDDTDDKDSDELLALAMDEADLPGLCAHCSGWGQRHGMELGEWVWEDASLEAVDD